MPRKLNRFRCRRNRLKAAGLCIRCGCEPARPGKTACGGCANVAAVKYAIAHPATDADGINRQLAAVEAFREELLRRQTG